MYEDDYIPSEEDFTRMVYAAMNKFSCDYDTAHVYVTYKLDGYSTQVAKVYAGLGDPN